LLFTPEQIDQTFHLQMLCEALMAQYNQYKNIVLIKLRILFMLKCFKSIKVFNLTVC
jgi:hypothetical protein